MQVYEIKYLKIKAVGFINLKGRKKYIMKELE